MTMDATQSGTRERLLEAAARLAYTQGVGVGVEALCKQAGVSKRSMYQLFASKDELLAASLEQAAASVDAQTLPPADAELSARERIGYVFRQLEERGPSPEYLGCPYLAVQVELKDPAHPASRVALRRKQALEAFFREQAELGGAASPELLARQLVLVFDGASARAGIGADALTGALATTLVTTLLDAAGLE
jgi:AcrR family transcriptional regulator